MIISCEAEIHALIGLRQNDLLCSSGFVEAFAGPPWPHTLKFRSNINRRASTNSFSRSSSWGAWERRMPERG